MRGKNEFRVMYKDLYRGVVVVVRVVVVEVVEYSCDSQGRAEFQVERRSGAEAEFELRLASCGSRGGRE